MDLLKNLFSSRIFILCFVWAIMGIVLSILNPYFIDPTNINNLLRQSSIYAVLAIGVTFVIITGGIDLSVGSVVGLTSIIAAMLIKADYSITMAIIITLIIGVIIGLINGILVEKAGLPPFIATLAGLVGYSGLSLILTNGSVISGMPSYFTKFSSESFLYVPNLFWITILVLIVSIFILHLSIYGRHLYAVGSNREAARLSGINVNRVVIISYIISSAFASIAGIMTLSRLAIGSPVTGRAWELEAIASSVIGGTSLFGAIGTAVGPFLGANILATIKNACNILNINSFYQQVITALLILIIVYLDTLRRNKK